MKLLIEELFGKIKDFSNGMNFFLLRWVIKLIFYILILLIIIGLIVLFYTKRGYFVLVILGLYIIAEILHFIRKLREQKLSVK